MERGRLTVFTCLLTPRARHVAQDKALRKARSFARDRPESRAPVAPRSCQCCRHRRHRRHYGSPVTLRGQHLQSAQTKGGDSSRPWGRIAFLRFDRGVLACQNWPKSTLEISSGLVSGFLTVLVDSLGIGYACSVPYYAANLDINVHPWEAGLGRVDRRSPSGTRIRCSSVCDPQCGTGVLAAGGGAFLGVGASAVPMTTCPEIQTQNRLQSGVASSSARAANQLPEGCLDPYFPGPALACSSGSVRPGYTASRRRQGERRPNLGVRRSSCRRLQAGQPLLVKLWNSHHRHRWGSERSLEHPLPHPLPLISLASPS